MPPLRNHLHTGCIALCLCSHLQLGLAQNWVEVVADRDVTLLIDKDSLRWNGKQAKYWLKYRWVKPQDLRLGVVYQSQLLQQLANCEQGGVGVLQRLLYSDPSGGQLLESEKTDESEIRLSDPAPGTFGEAAFEVACRMAKGRTSP